LRSYLVAAVRRKAKRQTHEEKLSRERRHKELLESRLSEVEREQQQIHSNLTSQLDAAQQELRVAVQAGEQLKLDRDSLAQQIQPLTSERQVLVQQIQRLETDTADLTRQIDDVRGRLSRSDACVAAAQQRVEEMEQQLQHAQALHLSTVQQLQQKLADSHDQTERVQETIELRQRHEALKESYELLRQSHEKLKERLIENENFLRTQEGKVAARFEKELAAARCKCAQAEADRDDIEATLETCKRQLQQAREQNATLRAYLEEDDVNKENRDSVNNPRHGFISNALVQARRTLQLGQHK